MQDSYQIKLAMPSLSSSPSTLLQVFVASFGHESSLSAMPSLSESIGLLQVFVASFGHESSLSAMPSLSESMGLLQVFVASFGHESSLSAMPSLSESSGVVSTTFTVLVTWSAALPLTSVES